MHHPRGSEGDEIPRRKRGGWNTPQGAREMKYPAGNEGDEIPRRKRGRWNTPQGAREMKYPAGKEGDEIPRRKLRRWHTPQGMREIKYPSGSEGDEIPCRERGRESDNDEVGLRPLMEKKLFKREIIKQHFHIFNIKVVVTFSLHYWVNHLTTDYLF